MSRRTLHPALRPMRRRVYHVRSHGAYRRLLTQCSRRNSVQEMRHHRVRMYYLRLLALRVGADDMVRVRYAFGSPWQFDCTPF